ncbi:pseudouridine synthase [Inhella gelatinilytica]|uniref:Pseudouridine synthase n=1 Tax=Inhella gelatinilytica TaxID=2795030 RepID=A0A931IVK5_9BURK|nr:16S rRNA pseudouridine(516) synthase [Inhella gelatinilytica]MBH9551458.1 16S rRNA pseudouridine(516) synthase [Inhella gelatinilytica]
MQLQQILFSQGFGTRHECAGLAVQGRVRVGGQAALDPFAEYEPDGLQFEVDGVPWPYQGQALVALHKPVGYECSTKPKHHPSVLSLLPGPLRVRGVQPVGRLDEDTTGLLLLTDDGSLIHRWTHPKKKVAKVYEATLKHPMEEAARLQLLQGVVLHDDPQPLQAEAAELIDSTHLRITLTGGRYHQVKRMVAAVGNRVEGLHRSQFGRLALPAHLQPGEWCWINATSV